MSMKGSPIGSWFKERRQSSQSGIPSAKRPATAAAGAFPWSEDRDFSKVVEQAVLAAFESNAFKIAIASQVDPAFAKTQDELDQCKTSSLNLESTLQAHVDNVPLLLDPIQKCLTSLEIPDYSQVLEQQVVGQKRLETQFNDFAIPDHKKELSDIASAQANLLKTIECQFKGLESRMEELDRRLGAIDEAVVNADLRSAIRFGEISNELLDRNVTLGDRVWGVERDLGKKVDTLQRKVVATCEEVGKSARSTHEIVETMRAKLEEDDVLTAVEKATSRAEFSEKALRRSIAAIQDKVASLDTSALSAQTARLEIIERGVSDFKKEAEAARNLASVSSKFLSANTSKLDSIATAVGKLQIMAEATNETCHEVSESQEQNAVSLKEDVEAVRMHVRSLDTLAVSHGKRLSETSSIMTRMESALVGSNLTAIGKLEDLESSISRVEDGLKPLTSHTAKLDGLQTNVASVLRDMKPHRAVLDDLTSTISEMRTNVDSALSSQTDSLDTIQQKVYDTSAIDQVASSLHGVRASIERKLSSSLEMTTKSAVEQINSQISVVELKLQAGLQSVAEDANSRAERAEAPMADVLEEARSIKSFLKSENADRSEQFRSTRELIEASQTAHMEDARATRKMLQDVQEASKDNEVLLQIESWAQRCISHQAAEGASVKELLQSSHKREEALQQSIAEAAEKHSQLSESLRSGSFESSSTNRELAALKAVLEHDRALSKETAAGTENALQALAALKSLLESNSTLSRENATTTQHALQVLQAGIQQILNDTTSSEIQDIVLQNATTMATAHKAVLAIDENLKSSEAAICLAVGGIQKTLVDELTVATANITSANVDGVAGLRTHLDGNLESSKDTVRSAVRDVQVALTKDLAAATASITSSDHERSTDLKTHLDSSLFTLKSALSANMEALKDNVSKSLKESQNDAANLKTYINSSLSASTNALKAELQTIYLSLITTAMEALKEQVSTSLDDSQSDVTRAVEGIQSSVSAAIDSLATDVRDFGNNHSREIQQNGAALKRITDAVNAHATTHAGELVSIQKAIGSISEVTENIALLLAVVEKLDQRSSSHAASLATTQESVLATRTQFDVVSNDLQSAIDTFGLKSLAAVEANNIGISELREASQEQVLTLRGDLKTSHIEAKEGINALEATILASIAGTAADVLLTKNEIAKVAASLARTEEVQRAIDKSHATAQSTLEINNLTLQNVEEMLKQAGVERRSIMERRDQAVLALEKVIHDSATESKAEIISKLAEATSRLGDAVTTATAGLQTALRSLEQVAIENKELSAGNSLALVALEQTVHQSTAASKDDIISEVTEATSRAVTEIASGLEDMKRIMEQIELEGEGSSEANSLALAALEKAIHQKNTLSKDDIVAELTEAASRINGNVDRILTQATIERKDFSEANNLSIKTLEKAVLDSTAESKAGVLAELAGATTRILETVNNASTNLKNGTGEISKSLDVLKREIPGLQESALRDNADLKAVVMANIDGVTSHLTNLFQAINKRLAITSNKTSTFLEAIKDDISGLGESVVRQSSALETAILTSHEDVNLQTIAIMKEVQTGLENVLAGTAKTREETRAITMEIATIHDAVLSDAAKSDVSMKSNFEAARSSIVLEVIKSTKNLCSDLSEIIVKEGQSTSKAATEEVQRIKTFLESKIHETSQLSVSEISKGIESIIQKASEDASKSCEVILEAVEAGSKSSVDVVMQESGKINDVVATIKTFVHSEAENTNKSMESLRGSLGTIAQDFENGSRVATTERTEAREIVVGGFADLTDLVQQQSAALARVQSEQREILSGVSAVNERVEATNDSLIKTIVRESQDALASLTDLAQQQATAVAAMETTQQEVLSALGTVNSATDNVYKALEDRTNHLSDSIHMGFSDALVHRTAAEKSREAGVATLSGFIKREAEATRTALESTQDRVVSDVASVSESLDTIGKSLEKRTDRLSVDVSQGFAEATTHRSKAEEALHANLTTISASHHQELESTRVAMQYSQTSITTDIRKSHELLASFAQTSKQSVEELSAATQMGFANATIESTESRKAQASHFATLSGFIHDGAKVTGDAVEAVQKGVAAEVKKTNFDLKHSLGGLKLQMEQISGNQNTLIAGLGDEIKGLDGKTHDRFTSLEASGEEHTNALAGTIDQMNISLQTELDSITDSMKVVDAAVRVNSAAIARVDKAVLESSSQVKNVVHDGNRDLLASLDEYLQDTSRRVRTLAEFDIPRLELLAKRNRDATEVIGGRVIGTSKKFDEMVTHHGQKPNGLDRSELMTASGRLRKSSNASSTRSKESLHYRMAAVESGRN